MMRETREMISHLTTRTMFFESHASSMVFVNGKIPEDKGWILAVLDAVIGELTRAEYTGRYDRDGSM